MTLTNEFKTIEVVYYLCDKCEYEAETYELPINALVLKDWLAEEGWTFTEDKSYCPDCKVEE